MDARIRASVSIIVNELIINDDNDSSEDEEIFMVLTQMSLRRRRRRVRIEGYSERLVPQLSDLDFKSHFRMSRTTFEMLLRMLEPRLTRVRRGPNLRPGRHQVDSTKQLLIAIWTLATPDSYRSVCERFGVGKASALSIVRRVIRALVSIRSTIIKWPNNEEAEQSAEFFEQKNHFPGVIGAIDGTHIRIEAPNQDPEAYINRKGYYSVQLQVICQQDLKFIHCFAGYPGSVHDYRVFQLSGVQAICSTENRFPNNTHLLGDAAYANQKHLLVPYKNNGRLTEQEVNYNNRLSSTRMVVERSIGLLKNRFRILLDRLPVRRMDLIPMYIMACCVLHNVCLLNEDYEEVPLVLPHQDDDVNDNRDVNDDNLRDEGRRKREMIKNGLP